MDFPLMVKITQTFDAPEIGDVAAAVRSELRRTGLAERISPGWRVAIAVGSRGIACIPTVVATVVAELKAVGAVPFIVPAMGSHGGSTAEGQREVLASLGVSEESCGARIEATMDVVEIGRLDSGMPVYMDRIAHGADAIIAVNRVKSHELFGRRFGSGVMKIIAIGLGKQKGCSTIHRHTCGNPPSLYDVIEQVARIAADRTPLTLGVAIVDNPYGRPARIVAMDAREIPEIEPGLYREARGYVPALPTGPIDLLIVERMGKNISPSGLDPFVVGDRVYGLQSDAPRIRRLVVLDLTDESHGNAVGVGAADLITERLFNKIDRRVTGINGIAGARIENCKIPVALPTDREVVEAGLSTIGVLDPPKARVVRIKSTLELGEMYVSQAMVEDVRSHPGVRVVGQAEPLRFDGAGNLA